MLISFVIPAHNEQETLRTLVEAIAAHVRPHEAQIILVDDGSTDDTGVVIAQLADEYAAVETVSFPQNLGKTAALATGIGRAKGEIVFTLDADMQDDPKEIPQFLAKLDQGWDLVCGWKAIRHDPWHKTFPSRVYNACIKLLFHIKLNDVNCGYKAMRKQVADSLALYGDRHRLIPILALQNGFRVTEIAVDHRAREHGRSNYGMERFVKGAADVFGLWFLSRYRESPGHFFAACAAIAAILGVLFAIFGGIADGAVASSVWLVLGCGSIGGSIALMGLGFLGELLVSLSRDRGAE